MSWLQLNCRLGIFYHGTNSGCNAVFNSTVIISALIYLTFTSPNKFFGGGFYHCLPLSSVLLPWHILRSVQWLNKGCPARGNEFYQFNYSFFRQRKYLWSLRNKDDGKGMIEKNPGSGVNMQACQIQQVWSERCGVLVS